MNLVPSHDAETSGYNLAVCNQQGLTGFEPTGAIKSVLRGYENRLQWAGKQIAKGDALVHISNNSPLNPLSSVEEKRESSSNESSAQK